MRTHLAPIRLEAAQIHSEEQLRDDRSPPVIRSEVSFSSVLSS